MLDRVVLKGKGGDVVYNAEDSYLRPVYIEISESMFSIWSSCRIELNLNTPFFEKITFGSKAILEFSDSPIKEMSFSLLNKDIIEPGGQTLGGKVSLTYCSTWLMENNMSELSAVYKSLSEMSFLEPRNVSLSSEGEYSKKPIYRCNQPIINFVEDTLLKKVLWKDGRTVFIFEDLSKPSSNKLQVINLSSLASSSANVFIGPYVFSREEEREKQKYPISLVCSGVGGYFYGPKSIQSRVSLSTSPGGSGEKPLMIFKHQLKDESEIKALSDFLERRRLEETTLEVTTMASSYLEKVPLGSLITLWLPNLEAEKFILVEKTWVYTDLSTRVAQGILTLLNVEEVS